MSADIKAALQSYLLSLGPLSELVDTRVSFGDRNPNTDLPAVTFYRQSGASVQNLDGPAGMGQARFVVECWGRSGEEAEAVALAVKGDREGPGLDSFYTARMGDVWVASARVEDLADDKVPPAFGEQHSDHRVSLEVSLAFDE